MTDVYSNNNTMDELNKNDLNFNRTSFSAYNDNYFAELIKNHLGQSKNDNEFYNKLVELKNEQKKTLIFMQELYEHKQQLKEELVKSEADLNDLKTTTYPIKMDDYKYQLNAMSAYQNPISNSSDNKDFQDEANKQILNNLNEYETIKNKMNSKNIFNKPPPGPIRTTTVTFEEKSSEKLKNNDNNEILESINEDFKRLEKAWNDFHLNDKTNRKSIEFNKKFVKKTRNNPKQKPNVKRPFSASVEWVPRITVPEPFSMTIRERVKLDQKQQKLLKELEEERERRVEAELKECKRKFKANPVPAHVYLPLYDQIKLDDELRKHKIKRMSKEYLEKVSKPFKITDLKKQSATGLKERSHSFSGEATVETKKADFNARPLPEFYFNEELINEKMKENELYKQISKQMRAIDLLKKSKLPHNLELQQTKKQLEMERNILFMQEMARLQEELDAKENVEINPRKTHEVPDYDELYKKFIIELETKKSQNRKETKVEPFVLRTALRARPPSATLDNSQNLSQNSKTNISRLSKSFSASMDALPIKGTELQKSRESVNKAKLDDMVRRELQKEHVEKIKKIRMKKLHDKIQEKANYDPTEVEKNIERRTKERKLEQRKREEDYELQLADIDKKIENRKLQIEQIEEENIRRALEKRYKDALKSAGLDERDLLNNDSVRLAKVVTNQKISDDWINQ